MPGASRTKEKDSQQQLNSIKNYFQAASKKRERSEDAETPISKYAKREENSSQAGSQTQPVTSLQLENHAERSQKESILWARTQMSLHHT
ncbi:hypothetical protein JRQ81_012884 [Phrynocephalus forsythii]|uniref:Uncharacterized protein n=1 Tax=Phrynocephalus forsythii TaxID=171643 RepID=A0A9Q0Y327_9SAUR|nr:hypothetical protein JRQ81_012884 [Phrynocephalus forsythii]